MTIKYAILDEGTVRGIHFSPGEVSDANYVPVDEGDDVRIGYIYSNGAFAPPPSPEPAPRLRLSKREFRNQFTMPEKQAIYTAAESSVDVRIFLDDLMAVDFVDLDFPDTMAAVNSLESAGLLAPGRASEILSGLLE